MLNQLIKNNASFTASVTALTASLKALMAVYTILAAGGTAPPPAANAMAPKKKKGIDPNVYCWLHGNRVIHGHTSAMCNAKEDGHKDAATRANPMVISTKNQKNST